MTCTIGVWDISIHGRKSYALQVGHGKMCVGMYMSDWVFEIQQVLTSFTGGGLYHRGTLQQTIIYAHSIKALSAYNAVISVNLFFFKLVDNQANRTGENSIP